MLFRHRPSLLSVAYGKYSCRAFPGMFPSVFDGENILKLFFVAPVAKSLKCASLRLTRRARWYVEKGRREEIGGECAGYKEGYNFIIATLL